MADEKNVATNISPSPMDVAGPPPNVDGTTTPSKPDDSPQSKPAAGPQAEPLSDGTVPTVLTAGTSHRTTVKGKTSLASVYRRADIMSTLLTFGGAVVAAAIILGVYIYVTRPKAAPVAVLPKVASLSASDLKNLNSFFVGNSAGNSSQVLTVNTSSLFDGRVAVNSDLDVVGGENVSGSSTLSNLSVASTSTLGVTAIRGSLNVAGPVNLQSPTVLGGGATVNGNVTTSGNGSFGGSLSAGLINTATLSVTTINLAGHINIVGQTPSVTPNSEAGSGATASISGNDTTGTVTVTTGSVQLGPSASGSLVTINFQTTYPTTARVLITAVGANTGALTSYVLPAANSFLIGTASGMASHTSYTWDYWVVQ